MNATRYSIHLEYGVEPICTKPYRLLESQKVDTEKHVEKLKKEGITEENSSLLVVAIKWILAASKI
jgi:hypothetical protein